MIVSLHAMGSKLIVFICITLFCGKYVSCDEYCAPGVKSIGYTVPKGDVLVRHGDPLDIYCVLHEEEAKKRGPNASQHLIFQRNSRILSGEMVQVINSTTIKLHVDKPAKANQENYMCIFKDKTESRSVCMNFVYVGVPPQRITSFKCISNNLDNLTCKWSAPENYVTTNYSLSYSIKTNTRYNCPKIEESEGSAEMSCMWSLSTDPIYRQSVPDYYFYLNMSNIFGTYSMPRMHFKHFEYVRPNAPENLKVLSKTWNSVRLHWTVPTTMQTFSKGLIHRILYQSAYGKKEWQSRPTLLLKDLPEVEFTLENLDYAHAYYDIRVSLRSAVADKNDDSLWSENASLTVLTESKKPDAPPKTNVGSFEMLTFGGNSYRNVRIYWSHTPEEKRNGQNFSYVVTLEGDENKTNTTENAYMLIERLSSHKSYTFFIRARNEMGFSDEKSVIKVPRHEDCPREPTRLTKEELGGGHYRLSWQPPKLEANQLIKNYTIFWCNDERDRPPCTGKLDWVVIPEGLTSYNQSIPSNKTYQFAISANTDYGSSGMTWAHCTDLYYKYSVGKINEFWRLSFGSNFVEVQWSFGCSDKSVTGFIIYYCPIRSPVPDLICKGPEKDVTVTSDENSAVINDLAPYTTYSLQVAAIINHTTYSQRSERMLTTTLEAAPNTPPTRLKLVSVTNTTITIVWDAPAITNGILKYYNIFYGNKTLQINPRTSITLTNLTSYENYTITLQACTVKCSGLSQTLNVQTGMGYPGIIRKPIITQNATYTLISWDRPLEPNGRNEYYELKIREKHDYENITSIFNTTDREWGIYSCGKDKKYNSFYVSVRAVNINADKTYHGKWSDEVESYCRSPSNFIIYILVPAIFLFILGMTYVFKKIYSHFQAMRDVGVKLPQGLQGEATETDINLSSWTQKVGSNVDHQAADDEEHLLMKKNEGSPNLNGDSSGCSSAHESVTGSVDTASNISSSTSDSGTEQPRTPSADDMTELSATTSLRQRNIRPSTINKSYVTLPIDPNSSGGTKLTPKSYCILGVDPNINTDGSSTYIPLPTIGEKPIYSLSESPHSPPYVLTGELVKTANPSYIPYKSNLPADLLTKNPAYVVAGNKDLLATDVLNIEDKQPIATQDSAYIKIADNLALKNSDMNNWQPPSLNTNTKTGYVSIGEVPPMKKEPKGYVPHRQFESKALKED